MGPSQITPEMILAWLGEDISNPSLRLRVNALRSFFTWSHASKGFPDNSMDIVPAVKLKKQQPAPVEAVSKVLVRPNPWIRLLVRLFADAGLRRTEAVVARTEDIIGDLTGRSLIVHVKGDKDRVVSLSTALENELKRVLKGCIFPGQLEGRLCGDMAYRLAKDAAGHSRPRESNSDSPTECRSLKYTSDDRCLDFYKLSPGNYLSFIYASQRSLQLIAIFEMFK